MIVVNRIIPRYYVYGIIIAVKKYDFSLNVKAGIADSEVALFQNLTNKFK